VTLALQRSGGIHTNSGANAGIYGLENNKSSGRLAHAAKWRSALWSKVGEAFKSSLDSSLLFTQGRSYRGYMGCHTPQICRLSTNLQCKFSFYANLQHTNGASRRWNASRAFFVGIFGLREVFLSANFGCHPSKRLP